MTESTSSANGADLQGESYTTLQKILAYGVHVYTATGVVWGMLAAISIFAGEFRQAFIWLLIAVIVDSSDGYFARKFQVKKIAPNINGAKLDDICDYLNYTFLPMLMIWKGNWLPDPAWLWCSVALFSSLFAFCNEGAKEDERGFFLGFPSYWNFVAFYIIVCLAHYGPYWSLSAVLFLSVLSFVPLRFIYPSRTPYWQGFFVWGAIVWTVGFLYVLWEFEYYSTQSAWFAWFTFSYPALYFLLSFYFDFYDRRKQKEEALQKAQEAGV